MSEFATTAPVATRPAVSQPTAAESTVTATTCSANAGPATPAERRADIDWLRVIAFGLLIYFHTAVAFLPDGLPMILNAEASLPLQVFVHFLHEFRLALLFMVAGMGVYFALRHRNRSAFLRERASRLLVPLVFGVLVVVPPMVFLEKLYLGQFGGNLMQFYQNLFSSGTYPRGNLSWHHYWFIAYLYLFCVLGWPLFARLRTATGRAWLEHRVTSLSQGAGLYLPIVLLLVVEVPLRPVFPGFRDLIHDGASFLHWFAIFVFGYVFANHTVLLNRAEQLRRISLVLAATATAVLFGQFWSPQHGISPLTEGPYSVWYYLAWCVVRMINVWCWLLVCVGYAARYLRSAGPLLHYLNQAVYPLFCLHLTVIVALDYLVLPLCWPIAIKFLVITSAALVIIFVLYEGLIRRNRWLRPLFGLRVNS